MKTLPHTLEVRDLSVQLYTEQIGRASCRERVYGLV